MLGSTICLTFGTSNYDLRKSSPFCQKVRYLTVPAGTWSPQLICTDPWSAPKMTSRISKTPQKHNKYKQNATSGETCDFPNAYKTRAFQHLGAKHVAQTTCFIGILRNVADWRIAPQAAGQNAYKTLGFRHLGAQHVVKTTCFTGILRSVADLRICLPGRRPEAFASETPGLRPQA